MIYDIHAHIAASGGGHGRNYISPDYRKDKTYLAMLERFDLPPEAGDWHQFDELIVGQTIHWLDESEVDRAVLLAMDFAYLEDGRLDFNHSMMATENEFVAEVVRRSKKALFGASVHPLREGALKELERVIEQGAALMQWTPVLQDIQPDAKACMPFYEMLAHYKIPLLCHCGSESSLVMFPDDLSAPRRLIPALECGVTVIAAHCGTRLKLKDQDYFEEWKRMVLKYERFYGDLSSFCFTSRLWPLGTMIETPELAAKLVFGSDFPSWTVPWSYVGQLGYMEVAELRKMDNPFDQAVATLRAVGVGPEIFERAGSLLRLAGAKPG
jgi:predicted TIM-barrel fold metal-dependent hydrolase